MDTFSSVRSAAQFILKEKISFLSNGIKYFTMSAYTGLLNINIKLNSNSGHKYFMSHSNLYKQTCFRWYKK